MSCYWLGLSLGLVRYLESFVVCCLRIILGIFNEAEEATHHHTQDGQTAEDLIPPHSVPSVFLWAPIQDVKGKTT